MAEIKPPIDDAVEERIHELVLQQGISELDYSQLLDLVELHAAAAGSVPGSPPWRFVGPRNVGGRVISLAQDPTDPRIIFAGAAQGGLWRSLDAGDTWTRLGAASDVHAVGAVAVAPTSPNTIYFGTGALKPTYISGRGLFRATIAGKIGLANVENLVGAPDPTVAPPNAPGGSALRYTRIRVDPFDATRFWAASQTGLWRCECPSGSPPVPRFFREFPDKSSNPGNAPIPNALTGGGLWPSYCTDLLVAPDPRETDTVQVGGVNVPRYLILYIAIEGNGVYRGRFDRDLGSAANPTSFEGSALTFPGLANTFTRIRLAQCERHPEHVYAIFADANDAATEIYHSADNGKNWTKGAQTMGALGGLNCGASYGLVLEVAPDDPSVVVAGEGDIFHSTDFGSHLTKILDWQRYDAGDKAQHADQHIAMFDIGDHRRVWIGNDGGLSLARDLRKPAQSFGYWRKRSHGIYAGMALDVSINPQMPFMTGIGLQDNGTFLSLGGPTWYHIGGGDGGGTAFNLTSPRQLFVSWQGGLNPPDGRGLERVDAVAFDSPSNQFDLVSLVAHDIPESVARGHGVRYRWTGLGGGIPVANSAIFTGVLEQHPTVAGSLLMGRIGDAFWSTNFGAAWNPLIGGLAPAPAAPGGEVSAMAFGHIEATNVVPANVDGWAGNSAGQLLFTSNAPTTGWAFLANQPPLPATSTRITEIAVHPIDRRMVAVSMTGLQGRVYLTYDQGNTWIDLTEPVPTALVVAPAGFTLGIGQVRSFTAIATYTGGVVVNVTARAGWTSSTAAATVVTASGAGGFALSGFGTEGQVTGAAVGTPNITATLLAGVPNGSATQAVTIQAAPVAPTPPVATQPRTIVPGSLPPGPVGSVIFDPSVAAAAPMTLLAGTLGGVYALTGIPAVVSLVIQPAGPLTFQTGTAPFQLRCVANLSDGSQIDVTKAVDWSNTAVGAATVTNASPNEGQITIGVVGSDTITATRAGIPPATIVVNVVPGVTPAPPALGALVFNRPVITWRQFNTGLPHVLVTDFERVGTTNAIRAATFGLGVFECITGGGGPLQQLVIRQTIIEDGRTYPRPAAPPIPDDPRLPAGAVNLDLTHAFDIRVDAPPYSFFDDVVDGVEFDEQLEVSDAVSTEENYVYVQVHNVGVQDVANVLVHLYAAPCAAGDVVNAIGGAATPIPASLDGAGAPPSDFYGHPNRDPIPASLWKRVDVARTLPLVPPDAPRVARFTWIPDVATPTNFALLALCEGNVLSGDTLPAAPAGATLSAFILAERRAALRVVRVGPRPPASLFVRDGIADDTRVGGYPAGGRSPDIMVVHPDIAAGTAATEFKDHIARRVHDTITQAATNIIYVRVHNRRRFQTHAQVKVFVIPLDENNAPNTTLATWTELPSAAAFADANPGPLGVDYARIELPGPNDPNPTGTNKTYLLLALIKSADNADPLPNRDRVDDADAFWNLVQKFFDADNAAARAIPWVP